MTFSSTSSTSSFSASSHATSPLAPTTSQSSIPSLPTFSQFLKQTTAIHHHHTSPNQNPSTSLPPSLPPSRVMLTHNTSHGRSPHATSSASSSRITHRAFPVLQPDSSQRLLLPSSSRFPEQGPPHHPPNGQHPPPHRQHHPPHRQHHPGHLTSTSSIARHFTPSSSSSSLPFPMSHQPKMGSSSHHLLEEGRCHSPHPCAPVFHPPQPPIQEPMYEKTTRHPASILSQPMSGVSHHHSQPMSEVEMDMSHALVSTIPKRRDRWTAEEHEYFLTGLETHGRKWKKIQGVVKTKTAIQVRTHAYGYFAKLLRNIPNNVYRWGEELPEVATSYATTWSLPRNASSSSQGQRQEHDLTSSSSRVSAQLHFLPPPPTLDERSRVILQKYVLRKKKATFPPTTSLHAASATVLPSAAHSINSGAASGSSESGIEEGTAPPSACSP